LARLGGALCHCQTIAVSRRALGPMASTWPVVVHVCMSPSLRALGLSALGSALMAISNQALCAPTIPNPIELPDERAEAAEASGSTAESF